MDSWMLLLLIAVLVLSLFRLLKTRQTYRGKDRSEEIRKQLAELRKKRDEQ